MRTVILIAYASCVHVVWLQFQDQQALAASNPDNALLQVTTVKRVSCQSSSLLAGVQDQSMRYGFEDFQRRNRMRWARFGTEYIRLQNQHSRACCRWYPTTVKGFSRRLDGRCLYTRLALGTSQRHYEHAAVAVSVWGLVPCHAASLQVVYLFINFVPCFCI